MKNTFKTLLFLLAPVLLFSQQRGVVPMSKPWGKGITRALIIGISNYEDPGISDLKFAHEDAKAFAEFLRSTSGGLLPDSQMVVLTDDRATGGSIISGFDWLIEKSNEQDVAIIYFAGHGDVETNRYNPWGYLLPYNSPARSYGLGAISIRYLQESIIPTLSAMKKARVILISDACHAGKLAGSSVGGSQITARKLMEQFDNEIKILSCQPNEVSVEGDQWGNGRGVFSYHLIEGLNGLADSDADSVVNLLEIGRYLEDIVPKEVAPMRQVPMTVGEKYTPLVRVHFESDLLSKKTEKSKVPGLSSVMNRKFNTDFFTEKDSSLELLYRNFEAALAAKNFFEPTGFSAEDLYQKLIGEPVLSSLHKQMTRNYAAALQDDAQSVLNGFLSKNTSELTKSRIQKLEIYKPYPKYLGRAADLLGVEHFFYKNLKARQFFFEGLLMWLENPSDIDKATGELILNKYRNSIRLEPDAPHAFFYMSNCFATSLSEIDSARFYTEKAVERAPGWVTPLAYLAYAYSAEFNQPAKAKNLLDKALSVDSTDSYVLQSLGAYYFHKEDYNNAIRFYLKTTQLFPTNNIAWQNLGAAYLNAEQYSKSEEAFRQSLQTDSIQYQPHYYLGLLYIETGKPDKAEAEFLKSIEINPNFKDGRMDLAYLYLEQNQIAEAEKLMKKVIDLAPKDGDNLYNLACLFAKTARPAEALEYLEKSFQNGNDDLEWMKEDADLDSVRELPAYKALIKKYF